VGNGDMCIMSWDGKPPLPGMPRNRAGRELRWLVLYLRRPRAGALLSMWWQRPDLTPNCLQGRLEKMTGCSYSSTQSV
jgi:hypothetical protein